MKKAIVSLLATFLGCFSATESRAQAPVFDSGSNGSYGAMNITQDTTLDMPPDGIFHCTTITVAANRTLRFNRNALNIPVYLLAQGEVTINGTINVSGSAFNSSTPGAGGPGGFDGGFAGFGSGQSSIGGDGHGPGAGRNNRKFAENGAVFSRPSYNTNTYGNALLSPLIGGSGGAGSDGSPGGMGGGGGGALLIASNTKITIANTASLLAIGGSGGNGGGGGSGGGIRMIAPVVTGLGNVSAGTSGGGVTDGGEGRVRIDTMDRYGYRSLHISGGLFSHGSQMFVFPPVVPRLDIVEAAGQSIPAGTPNAVNIELPAGSPTNQVVKLQARDFTGSVPIRVVVTPESGPSRNYDALIDMTSGNPAQASVNVIIPAGTISRLYAWTR
jgi:hypothetical protein